MYICVKRHIVVGGWHYIKYAYLYNIIYMYNLTLIRPLFFGVSYWSVIIHFLWHLYMYYGCMQIMIGREQ